MTNIMIHEAGELTTNEIVLTVVITAAVIAAMIYMIRTFKNNRPRW